MSEINQNPQETHVQGTTATPIRPLLNEGQRRTVGTVLRRLERAAWQLEEQIAHERQPELTLTSFIHSPSTLQQDLLVRLARCLRQEIAVLAQHSGVEKDEEDMLRSLHAMFTLLWVDLEDIRPQKLRNYGTLHPQLIETFGPRIQQVIDLVLAIDGVVQNTYDHDHLQNMIDICEDTGQKRAYEQAIEGPEAGPSH
jgi:hypothetical protein